MGKRFEPQRLQRRIHRLTLKVEIDAELAFAVETADYLSSNETARERLERFAHYFVDAGLEEMRVKGKLEQLKAAKETVEQLEMDLGIKPEGE